MNWKIKRLLSRCLVRLPMHEYFYDCTQKYLTKRWARNVAHTLQGESPFVMHLKFWHRHVSSFESVQYLEFGVGRDLFSNLLGYCLGIRFQMAVDLYPYARRELINDIIRQLQKVRRPDFVRVPEKLIGKDMKEDLANFYGIKYCAPCDLLSIPSSAGPFQILATTSVFEHIPENQVAPILAHCYRLCDRGALMSHQIDYSDHYAHRDRSISPYNFLQFSDTQWSRLYMPHYYTNRFRHPDYRALLIQNGFRILGEHVSRPEGAEDMLRSIRLDERFRDYPLQDLSITQGVFYTTKA